jgi:cytolysin-activating lysine-acyltransferase
VFLVKTLCLTDWETVLVEQDQFSLIGQAVFIYGHCEVRRHYSVNEIATDIVLPINLNQYRLYYSGGRPVGFVTWAYVSDDLLGRLAADQVVELSVDDWRSGRNIWLMDMVAPFGHGRAIANDLRRNIFGSAIFHSMRRYPDGRSKYTRWRGAAVPSRKQEGR